jgi:hypothetical protein
MFWRRKVTKGFNGLLRIRRFGAIASTRFRVFQRITQRIHMANHVYVSPDLGRCSVFTAGRHNCYIDGVMYVSV